jgi:hypothetical protein
MAFSWGVTQWITFDNADGRKKNGAGSIME